MSKIKKWKNVLWPIFITLSSHALWRPLIYAPAQVSHDMKDFLKLHELEKFLEASNFGYNFIDLERLM